MTDLHNRFRTLDKLSAPNLWYDIEERALAMQPTPRRNSWVLVVVMLLLTLLVGGAALVGSGILKLPAVVDASASPSATAQESADASSSPVEVVPASWTATGSMIEDRADHTATVLPDGRVLVVGGFSSSGGGAPVASAELYDPGTGSWTATASMIQIRPYHTATLLPNGTVLVVGGYSYGSGGLLAGGMAELYDPNTGSWTATGSMIEARSDHTATLLPDGRVLVVGGYSYDSSGGPLASAELYDPGTGSWTATGSMVEVRDRHTATLLLDGTVLVVGGYSFSGGGGTVASAARYDPNTGSWTATGSMIEARANHTATLLPDGRVLVAGSGGGDGSSTVASAELYDPSSGSWTPTGSMIEARSRHTATLLPDGMVLVAGSGGGDGIPVEAVLLASAELYDPDSGT